MGRPPGQDSGRPRRAVVSKRDGCYWARVPDITRSRGAGGGQAPGAARPALPGEAVGWPEMAPSPPGSDSAGVAPSAPSPRARVGLHRTHAGGGREGQSGRGGHLQPPWRTGTASPPLHCLGVTPGGPPASDASPAPPHRQSCTSEKALATSSSTPAVQMWSAWPIRKPGASPR